MSAKNIVFLMLVALCSTLAQSDQPKIFNLKAYGVVEGGKVDISKTLLKAWNDACSWKGKSVLVVPKGTYLVGPTRLKGPCSGPIGFRHLGTFKAPSGLRGDYWIEFRYLNHLTVEGGGLFDGQGPPTHAQPNLPTLLRFTFVEDSSIQNVKLINSQSTHFHLFGCNRTTVHQIKISSPGNSPNTDGIKIGDSTSIAISDSTIASGDDCVALIRGSKDIRVTGVVCGPGHGLSIGSMGGSPMTPIDRVERVLMQNCKIFNASSGLRIKTWAKNIPGLVQNITYQDISLTNVDNPIIIDQNYCPLRNCPKGNSKVQIRDVKFKNIHGTSVTNDAVKLLCSGSNPCQKIELSNINIKNVKGEKQATISTCSNVNIQATGVQIPKPCSVRI